MHSTKIDITYLSGMIKWGGGGEATIHQEVLSRNKERCRLKFHRHIIRRNTARRRKNTEQIYIYIYISAKQEKYIYDEEITMLLNNVEDFNEYKNYFLFKSLITIEYFPDKTKPRIVDVLS